MYKLGIGFLKHERTLKTSKTRVQFFPFQVDKEIFFSFLDLGIDNGKNKNSLFQKLQLHFIIPEKVKPRGNLDGKIKKRKNFVREIGIDRRVVGGSLKARKVETRKVSPGTSRAIR